VNSGQWAVGSRENHEERIAISQPLKVGKRQNNSPMLTDHYTLFLFLLFSLVVLSGCNAEKGGPQRTQTQGPAPKTPAQTPKIVQPISILSESTLFTVYGRAFNCAPILGRLGTYRGFDDMEKDIQPWLQGIRKRHSKKQVIPAIHLIYAMATPCKPGDDCLLYLEGTVKDLIGTYIEPAAKRGWMVVLDTQIGKSTPEQQVQRIINKGYLRYDNVAIALDPEFHVHEGRETPGKPIGSLTAVQINSAQKMISDYARTQRLPTKKILMVHQFGDPNINDGVPFMIKDKKKIMKYDNVELVLAMDGLGGQEIKVVKYNKILDAKVYPFIQFRGIKLFFNNRWEKHGHFDKPPLNLDQLFGIKPASGGVRMQTKPDILIIA
jgi:hypothetical protein